MWYVCDINICLSLNDYRLFIEQNDWTAGFAFIFGMYVEMMVHCLMGTKLSTEVCVTVTHDECNAKSNLIKFDICGCFVRECGSPFLVFTLRLCHLFYTIMFRETYCRDDMVAMMIK